MLAIWKNIRGHQCYKIIFHKGLLDMPNLVLFGALDGWFSITGAVFCTHPTFFYIKGCFLIGQSIIINGKFISQTLYNITNFDKTFYDLNKFGVIWRRIFYSLVCFYTQNFSKCQLQNKCQVGLWFSATSIDVVLALGSNPMLDICFCALGKSIFRHKRR